MEMTDSIKAVIDHGNNTREITLVVNRCPQDVKNRFRAWATAQGLTSARALSILVSMGEHYQQKFQTSKSK